MTIARSRKHIQTFYDTTDIGHFPERRKPLSFHCPLTHRTDVMGFNEIFEPALAAQARGLCAAQLHPPQPTEEVRGAVRHAGRQAAAASSARLDREQSLQALMTVNLLKRLESSVEAFRLTLQIAAREPPNTLAQIAAFKRPAATASVTDLTRRLRRPGRRRRRTARPRRGGDASAARSRSAWPTWTCRPGSTT